MFVFSKGRPYAHNLICDRIKKDSSKKRSKYSTSFATKDGRIQKISTENNKNFSRRTNLWKIPNGQKRGLNHPAPFPEQLANDHIVSWSNDGDLVYDPFGGSGTTAKMAIKNNRSCMTAELSNEYCDIIRELTETA